MFLATTANQLYWKKDEKIMFLGEWCKVYDQKHIWSKLDHETRHSYLGLSPVEFEKKNDT